MAADSWTITAGNRDYLDIELLINDAIHRRRVPISQITAANQAAALVKLRALLVAYRDSVLAEKAVPAVISSAVGYTEPF